MKTATAKAPCSVLARKAPYRKFRYLTLMDWPETTPEIVGTASQGRPEEEALANLQEATDLYLESFPPHPEKASGHPHV
jgi:hypothetical protein